MKPEGKKALKGRKRKNGSRRMGEELSSGEGVEGETWETGGRGQVFPVL